MNMAGKQVLWINTEVIIRCVLKVESHCLHCYFDCCKSVQKIDSICVSLFPVAQSGFASTVSRLVAAQRSVLRQVVAGGSRLCLYTFEGSHLPVYLPKKSPGRNLVRLAIIQPTGIDHTSEIADKRLHLIRNSCRCVYHIPQAFVEISYSIFYPRFPFYAKMYFIIHVSSDSCLRLPLADFLSHLERQSLSYQPQLIDP